MKRVTQVICLLLIFSFIIPICAQASVRASDYFNYDSCFLHKVSSTEFDVCFDVLGTGPMLEIGTSVITVQQSSDGSKWSDVFTFTKKEYPQMICKNTVTHGDSVSYSSAVPGYYYRAYVIFYAKKSSNAIGELGRYTSKIKL